MVLPRAAPRAGFYEDSSNRLALAVIGSALLHTAVLTGVGFKLPDPRTLANFTPPIDVVLVNSRSVEKPRDAQALAQVNLDGGGNTDEARRAKSPMPAKDLEAKEIVLEQASRKVQQLEEEARKLMTEVKEDAPAPPPPPEVRPEPVPEPAEGPTASELMQRSMQIARLHASIEKDWDSYQKRPRRKFIGARVEEYRFARYVEDWRMKVERVGNLNYPEEARRDRIFGRLQMTVSIRSDGRVEKVEVNRSSGHKVLDQAAVRIVKLAAPFATFPDEIRRDTDILSITRTWIFTRADQLVAE